MPVSKESFIRIYDEFRDCEFNKEYYAYRAQKVRARLRYLDIFLALFAGSSAVLSFSLWNFTLWGVQLGQISLGVLVGLAIIFGIAKPYLKWEDTLERVSSIQGGYASLAHMHRDNVQRVKESKDVDSKAETVFQTLRSFRGMLHPKEDQNPDPKLKSQFFDTVNRRFPSSFFYYPEENLDED